MKKNKSGFTIVELLIVIVVIAILAAIAIVAYNGIQDRAYVTRVNTNGKAFSKALQLYVASGRTDLYSSYGNGCLGSTEDYPAKDGFASGQCSRPGEDDTSNIGNNISVNETYLPVLQEFSRGLSARDIRPVYSGDYDAWRRGYYVSIGSSNGLRHVSVTWHFKGEIDCGKGLYTSGYDWDSSTGRYTTTVCSIYFSYKE